MRISHEVPLCLLQESKQFNDYDYCLLHLIYENKEYKDFYVNSKREVLLDNSAFELGDALVADKVAAGVLEIKPTWYVVPDCLNNCDETIKRWNLFVDKYPNLPGLRIGVVHGSSIEELIACYKFMSKYADKIAIPFGSTAYDPKKQYEGRYQFIKYLVDNGIWNYEKPHHLLGCSLACEFKQPLYHTLNIDTVDTSNPIMLGMCNEVYNESFTNKKPTQKLYTLINASVSLTQRCAIYNNVIKFREIIR